MCTPVELMCAVLKTVTTTVRYYILRVDSNRTLICYLKFVTNPFILSLINCHSIINIVVSHNSYISSDLV